MSEKVNANTEKTETYPAWLSGEYFQTILREKYSDSLIVVKKINIGPAAPKGAHFSSALFRVQLEYSTNNDSGARKISVIVKTQPDSTGEPTFSEALGEMDVCTHEMLMYDEIFPKMNEQLIKAGIKTVLVPSTLKIDRNRKCMIIEDLSASNYFMSDKMIGLDLQHAKLALKKIAAFHAAAAKVNEIDTGSLQKRFKRNVFTDNSLEPFFAGHLEACRRAVKKWKGFEQYGDKLLRMVPKIIEMGRRLFAPQSNQFNTLIHSDFWLNNMMFKYDDNKKPTDSVLIDFQFNCWTSPAIDLHYFINTSVNEELRWGHEETLVKYYHTNLVEILKKLGYSAKIPDSEEFWSQYLDKGFNAVTSVCMVIPIIWNQHETNLMENDENAIKTKETLYDSPKVQKLLKKLLPLFDQRGFLDCD